MGVAEHGTLTAANVEAVDVCHPFVHPREVEHHRGLVRLRTIRRDDEGLKAKPKNKTKTSWATIVKSAQTRSVKRAHSRKGTRGPWGKKKGGKGRAEVAQNSQNGGKRARTLRTFGKSNVALSQIRLSLSLSEEMGDHAKLVPGW